LVEAAIDGREQLSKSSGKAPTAVSDAPKQTAPAVPASAPESKKTPYLALHLTREELEWLADGRDDEDEIGNLGEMLRRDDMDKKWVSRTRKWEGLLGV
jgi:hypothetical protein